MVSRQARGQNAAENGFVKFIIKYFRTINELVLELVHCSLLKKFFL